MGKRVIVKVKPPCISSNRELSYYYIVKHAYNNGKLENCMEITKETEDTVYITMNR